MADLADARERWAHLLYSIGGWSVFAPHDEDHDRPYVSRLWAQDWDCAEDSAYDEGA